MRKEMQPDKRKEKKTTRHETKQNKTVEQSNTLVIKHKREVRYALQLIPFFFWFGRSSYRTRPCSESWPTEKSN